MPRPWSIKRERDYKNRDRGGRGGDEDGVGQETEEVCDGAFKEHW